MADTVHTYNPRMDGRPLSRGCSEDFLPCCCLSAEGKATAPTHTAPLCNHATEQESSR